MNRRRVIAAVFFSLVVIAVLGVIVGAEVVSAGQSVSVLRLRTTVLRGALFSPADVDVVTLRLAPGDLSYEVPGSVPEGARYAVSLRAGDLLSPDDLESAGAQAEVTLTVSTPPPIEAGDSVDIFAALGQSQVLIGHAVAVLQVSGDQLTVLVGAEDELAWVEIAASNTQLHAVVSDSGGPTGIPPSSVEQAVCQLAPAECASLVPGSSGVASPAPSGAAVPTPVTSP